MTTTIVTTPTAEALALLDRDQFGQAVHVLVRATHDEARNIGDMFGDASTETALVRLHTAWRGVAAAIDRQEQFSWAVRALLEAKHGVRLGGAS